MLSRRNFLKIGSLSLMNLLWSSYNDVSGFDVKSEYKSKDLISNLKNKLSYKDIGFRIGPLINSSGRIAKANDVVELFLSQNDDKIDKMYQLLVFCVFWC